MAGGETIRDVTVRVRIVQDDAKLHLPEIAPVTAGVHEAQRATQDLTQGFIDLRDVTASAYNLTDKLSQQATESKQREAEAIRKAAEDAERARAQTVQFGQQATDAFARAGQGAFTLARGVAFMAAGSNKELQQVLQSVALVQGGFDAFKGTVEVIKSVREGVQFFSNATKAAAAAQTVATVATTTQTAATTGLAAAEGVAAAGAVTLTAALGPIAVGLAAVSAVALAAGTGLLSFGDAAEEAGSQASQRFGAAIDEIRSKRDEFIAETIESRQRLFDSERSLSDIALGGSTNIDDRLRQIRELQDNARTGTFNASVPSEGDDSKRGRLQDQLNNIKAQVAAEQTLEQIGREKLSILDATIEANERTIQQAERERAIRYEQLKIEEDRYASEVERIGKLNEFELQQVKKISSKAAAGEQITTADAAFLQSTGLGQGLAAARFRQAGEERGAEGILRGLGDTKGLDQARENVRSAENTFGDAVKDLRETQTALQAERQADAMELVRTVKGIFEKQNNDIKLIVAELKKIDNARNASAAHRSGSTF